MKAKIVTTKDGRTFAKGWSRCFECGKRIKFCLPTDIALTTSKEAMLCSEDKVLVDHEYDELQFAGPFQFYVLGLG